MCLSCSFKDSTHEIFHWASSGHIFHGGIAAAGNYKLNEMDDHSSRSVLVSSSRFQKLNTLYTTFNFEWMFHPLKVYYEDPNGGWTHINNSKCNTLYAYLVYVYVMGFPRISQLLHMVANASAHFINWIRCFRLLIGFVCGKANRLRKSQLKTKIISPDLSTSHTHWHMNYVTPPRWNIHLYL